MLKVRVIPCLLLQNESLVKTIKFNKWTYIGDAINTVRIFNEMEVEIYKEKKNTEGLQRKGFSKTELNFNKVFPNAKSWSAEIRSVYAV